MFCAYRPVSNSLSSSIFFPVLVNASAILALVTIHPISSIPNLSYASLVVSKSITRSFSVALVDHTITLNKLSESVSISIGIFLSKTLDSSSQIEKAVSGNERVPAPPTRTGLTTLLDLQFA